MHFISDLTETKQPAGCRREEGGKLLSRPKAAHSDALERIKGKHQNDGAEQVVAASRGDAVMQQTPD